MIFAIDPGTTKSAWVMLDDSLKPARFGISPNEDLLADIVAVPSDYDFVIEMIASYGMAVGKEVFERKGLLICLK